LIEARPIPFIPGLAVLSDELELVELDLERVLDFVLQGGRILEDDGEGRIAELDGKEVLVSCRFCLDLICLYTAYNY